MNRKKMYLVKIFFLISLIKFASCYWLGNVFKECPKPIALKNLQVNKIAGRWHVNKFSSKLLRKFQCMETTYTFLNKTTNNNELILLAESIAWS